MSNRFGDTVFTGHVSVQGSLSLRPDQQLPASNHEHQHKFGHSQASGSAAAAVTIAVDYVIATVAELRKFSAGLVVPAVGDATVSVDLKKNGASVLSAPISLTSALAAYDTVDATISATSLAVGDVLTVVQTVNAGTGTLPQGVFSRGLITEQFQ